jgi:hypothetical protein
MTVPRQWAHGDQPTATLMNQYAAALTEAHDSLGEYAIQPLRLKSSEAEFSLLHTWRYLHFTSSGALVDPAGVAKEIGLSEDETGRGVLDLDGTWVAYGAVYHVRGCSACVEDYEP